MDKKRLSRILAAAPRQQVLDMAAGIEAAQAVRVVRPPAKTLVMLRVKEPVKQSLFYLGETVAAHCSVELAGSLGVAVVMGDDFGRARAMAVLDAAHTAGLPQFAALETALLALEAEQIAARRKEAAKHRKTQVNFRILEDSAS